MSNHGITSKVFLLKNYSKDTEFSTKKKCYYIVARIFTLVSVNRDVYCSGIPNMKKGNRLYFSNHELREWIRAGRRKTLAETGAEASKYVSKT